MRCSNTVDAYVLSQISCVQKTFINDKHNVSKCKAQVIEDDLLCFGIFLIP